MAKTIKCAFCGKELTKGFFSGTSETLYIGKTVSVHCCEDCYKRYEAYESDNKRRFEAKLTNWKRLHGVKKLDEQQLAALYAQYVAGEDAQKAKTGDDVLGLFENFYCFNNKGQFSVREFANGFMDEDVRASKMIKSIKKSREVETYAFDKNDITKIEYAPNGMGEFLGFFSKAYSYSIRFNDESEMTYKPCVTRTAVLGRGIIGHRRSAEKHVVKELEAFKKIIGSDLPIVKVKKFR